MCWKLSPKVGKGKTIPMSTLMFVFLEDHLFHLFYLEGAKCLQKKASFMCVDHTCVCYEQAPGFPQTSAMPFYIKLDTPVQQVLEHCQSHGYLQRPFSDCRAELGSLGAYLCSSGYRRWPFPNSSHHCSNMPATCDCPENSLHNPKRWSLTFCFSKWDTGVNSSLINLSLSICSDPVLYSALPFICQMIPSE